MADNEPKLIKEVKVYVLPCPKCSGMAESEVNTTYHTYETSTHAFITCDECGYSELFILSPDI